MDITGRLDDEARDAVALDAQLLRPQAVIPGTGGSDQLRGTAKADRISARAGDDVVRGLQGNDVLNGGAGGDDLRGGTGRDVLRGGSGDDTLAGGRGPDRLQGGAGNDILDGKAGRDLLIGGGGEDVFAYTVFPGGIDRIVGFSEGVGPLRSERDPAGLRARRRSERLRELRRVGRGTDLAVDPAGTGDFQRIARLDGVSISSLSADDLGLPSNLPEQPTVVSVDGGESAWQRHIVPAQPVR